MHGKLWAHVSGKLSSSLQHPETTLAALRRARWPASLSWVDKHRGDLTMYLLLISFTPTPLKTPCICPVSHSAPPPPPYQALYVINQIQQFSCALLPVVRQGGGRSGPVVSNGCFGSVSCEKARQLFRFKTINRVICPKTAVGMLDEQQNDEFPAASSSRLRPSTSLGSTERWYLHAWIPQKLPAGCSIRLLSSDDNSSF